MKRINPTIMMNRMKDITNVSIPLKMVTKEANLVLMPTHHKFMFDESFDVLSRSGIRIYQYTYEGYRVSRDGQIYFEQLL